MRDPERSARAEPCLLLASIGPIPCPVKRYDLAGSRPITGTPRGACVEPCRACRSMLRKRCFRPRASGNTNMRVRTNNNTAASSSPSSGAEGADRRRSPRIRQRGKFDVRPILSDGVGAPMTLVLQDISTGDSGRCTASRCASGISSRSR
jgi:hypothetical protein